MNTKNIILATLFVTNLTAIAMAVSYKHTAKENQQNFDQAVGEQDQMQAEFEADRKEGCQDEVDAMIDQVLNETLASCEKKITFLENELSDQAATLRKYMPKRFKGEQASSYFVRLKQLSVTPMPPLVSCGSDSDCCDKNPERCAADNFRPY